MTTTSPSKVMRLDRSGKKGEFQRTEAKWRNWIQDSKGDDKNGMKLFSSYVFVSALLL
jgi:glutathionyl-hydroquinone reductase